MQMFWRSFSNGVCTRSDFRLAKPFPETCKLKQVVKSSSRRQDAFVSHHLFVKAVFQLRVFHTYVLARKSLNQFQYDI